MRGVLERSPARQLERSSCLAAGLRSNAGHRSLSCRGLNVMPHASAGLQLVCTGANLATSMPACPTHTCPGTHLSWRAPYNPSAAPVCHTWPSYMTAGMSQASSSGAPRRISFPGGKPSPSGGACSAGTAGSEGCAGGGGLRFTTFGGGGVGGRGGGDLMAFLGGGGGGGRGGGDFLPFLAGGWEGVVGGSSAAASSSASAGLVMPYCSSSMSTAALRATPKGVAPLQPNLPNSAAQHSS